MKYMEVGDVIPAEGLRIILLRGFPSPWGQAAKAMIEFKSLDFKVGALQAGGENVAVKGWSGINSAPVVAWNDETPLNRWDDILLLLERLAPDRPLLPEDLSLRTECLGLSYALCGELGFGWNRRLDGVHRRVQAGGEAGLIGDKYGYNQADGERAAQRSIAFLQYLAKRLQSQAEQGSHYLVGSSVTAADFYWAAFSNLVVIQSPEDCPLDPSIRPIFEQVDPTVSAAVEPIVMAHRDRIMKDFFKLPMEL